MKINFINNKNKDDLILFFAGFAQDKDLLSNIKTNKSLALIYDYTNLDFVLEDLYNFKNIYLVAWSMGVCVANYIFNKDIKLQEKLQDSIAINGTNLAIDDKYGIAINIYRGTLNNLDDTSFNIFLRRMCKDEAHFNDYLKIKTKRSIASLKEELSVLETFYTSILNKDLNIYKKAYLGKLDSIFSYRSQNRYWNLTNIKTEVVPITHYDKDFIKDIILNIDKY